MVPAVIEFDFDPALHLGDLDVRWETLALALTIVICVALAAVMAGRTSSVNAAYPEMGGRERVARHLRRDDLLYILLGVVPAAVLGGRLGYVLIHWDFYSEHPEAWFDPTQGSLELSLAVVFGMIAGYAVAAGLGAPAGRWLHLAAIPTLLGLTVGKVAGVVGGTGQGAESDLAWATAYLGPGPWGSLDAATPAHPSQLYEALLSLLVMGTIVYLLRMGRFRDHDGRVFFAAMSLWALSRFAAAFTWRDPEVFGPFRAAQVIAITIAFVYFCLFVLRATYTRRTIRAILAARAREGRPAVVPAAAAARAPAAERASAATPSAAPAHAPAAAAAGAAAARRAAPRAERARSAEAAMVAAAATATAQSAAEAARVPATLAPMRSAANLIEVERLAAAAPEAPAASAVARSWRTGPVWLEHLEATPADESAPPPRLVRPVVEPTAVEEPVQAAAAAGPAGRRRAHRRRGDRDTGGRPAHAGARADPRLSRHVAASPGPDLARDRTRAACAGRSR